MASTITTDTNIEGLRGYTDSGANPWDISDMQRNLSPMTVCATCSYRQCLHIRLWLRLHRTHLRLPHPPLRREIISSAALKAYLLPSFAFSLGIERLYRLQIGTFDR